MHKYFYKCFNCSTDYSASQVEENNFYLCPKCGKAEKNKPLEGVLYIEYDYNDLKNKLSREKILKLPPGKFWLYPELWPIKFEDFNSSVLNKLALPSDQLLNYHLKNREVWVLDDTRNPTLSYKDRASSLIVLKALELGISEIVAASTGNAGSSLAGICARFDLKARIYVPDNIPEEKRIQIEAYGAKLELIDGDYDKAYDICIEESINNRRYNRSTAYNPLTIEGKKSAAYDIFISSNGNIPDLIFVPVGDGVIISGIYKGFSELYKLGWIDKLPKLIAVQSMGSNALVRYLETGKFEYKSVNTIADSISAGAPRNLYMAAQAVNETNGFAIAVSDEEILLSQKEFIEETGILCEPSCASVYAAFKDLTAEKNFAMAEKILLLITGNGLKDIKSLKTISGT